MSLQLNVSNSLNELAGQLAISLMKQPYNVFQKQYLVTQTDGMNNWLTIQLATQMGIVANCRFLKPNDIIGNLYYWLGGDTKQVLAKDHLQWLIYNLLDEPSFAEKFKIISDYYQGDDVKRIALAGKVADLFDQYQVYRPEMVEEWNKSAIDSINRDEWQKYVWIQVKEKTGDDITDKTSVAAYIIQQLKDPVQQERLVSRLPYLHIFGVSIITRLHIQLFNELSKLISVSFYLLNPAPMVYWLDDRTEKQIARFGRLQKRQAKPEERIEGTGNGLLISWGKVIQETFSMLFENEDFLNVYDDSNVEEPVRGTNDTLLQKIQQDIFYNHDAANRNLLSPDNIKDGSLTLNACYTPVREVEVLYNYLVHLLDQKKKVLSARDIVVMVSDIDAYAPYIKAIFNTAPYPFPYTIADESYESGDSLFTAIEIILSLEPDSFKAEEVIQLFDSRYIRERFNIAETAVVRKVVNMANIRFGIEGSPDYDTDLVSWNVGLERILYGICMSGATEYNVGDHSIYPLDVAEGADALELIRFGHFVEVLKWYVKDRLVKRSLGDWGEYIRQLTDDLVFQSDTNETEEDYQRLLQYIENLNVLTATYNEVVSFEVFKHSFLDIIASETRSRSFASGGITFCSLIPMRSIPFKIVALLGMNFDKFPRRETAVSFNLMEKKRRKGDRNVKDNDKHLFLETVLSAKEYLYVSYIGRNAKDNSIHPPSALVDELVDYVESGAMDTGNNVRGLLIKTQPLHGFSQKYFQHIPGIYSYLGEEVEGIVPGIEPASVVKDKRAFEWEEITIDSLLAFFKDPFKWYYNKVFGIYYGDEEILLPDTEIFELNKLMEWKLKNDLMYIDGDEVESYRVKSLKTGNLPLKNMSEIQVAKTFQEITPLKKLFKECVGTEIERELMLHIQLENLVVSGKLKNVYGDNIIVISFSKNYYKYLLGCYIRYVMATAQGLLVELSFLSAEHQSKFIIPKNTYTKEQAVEILKQLVNWFKKGHADIFLFFPGLSENPLKLLDYDLVKFNIQLNKYLERYPNLYLQKEYDDGIFETAEAVAQFQRNTRDIFLPVSYLFPTLLPLPKAFSS